MSSPKSSVTLHGCTADDEASPPPAKKPRLHDRSFSAPERDTAPQTASEEVPASQIFEGPDKISSSECSRPNAHPAQPAQGVNSSRCPQEPFIIELCAGSARVTSCLQHFGLKASFGVDHKRGKNSGRLL